MRKSSYTSHRPLKGNWDVLNLCWTITESSSPRYARSNRMVIHELLGNVSGGMIRLLLWRAPGVSRDGLVKTLPSWSSIDQRMSNLKMIQQALKSAASLNRVDILRGWPSNLRILDSVSIVFTGSTESQPDRLSMNLTEHGRKGIVSQDPMVCGSDALDHRPFLST